MPAISALMGRALVAAAWSLGAAGVAMATPPQVHPLSTRMATAPVNGLIVKLKNASAHERMSALDAGNLRAGETRRLQKVLTAARMTEVRVKPSGRDAQHFDFGHRLSLAEAEAKAVQLRAQPDVEWVELNRREQLLQSSSNIPNDSLYAYASPNDTGQWWLHPDGGALGVLPESWGVPDVQTAWLTQKGSSAAIVAVLDTGITNHTELSGRSLPGYDFVSDSAYSNDGDGRDFNPADPGDWVSASDQANSAFTDCDQQDSSWHGTIISGIVAASTNNVAGVAGVNWNGRVLPVRVAGKCGAEVLDIIDGMRWAAGLAVTGAPTNPYPARIINISFGGDAECGRAYQDTIDEVTGKGVVVVAAAGNASGALTRPANCQRVVAVAALARNGLKAGYSSFGSQVVISTVGGNPAGSGGFDPYADDGLLTIANAGLTAPGAQSYKNVFGTSFATPVVSGVISLMLSANPNLTVAQIISDLQLSSRPHVQSTDVTVCSSANPEVCVCTTNTCGAGILDADRAVQMAITTPAGVPPSGNGDSGGGVLGWNWLLGLALGVISAGRCARRHIRRST